MRDRIAELNHMLDILKRNPGINAPQLLKMTGFDMSEAGFKKRLLALTKLGCVRYVATGSGVKAPRLAWFYVKDYEEACLSLATLDGKPLPPGVTVRRHLCDDSRKPYPNQGGQGRLSSAVYTKAMLGV